MRAFRSRSGLVIFLLTIVFLSITVTDLWPFRQQRFIHSLELLSVCHVKATSFKPIFFPAPGYLATGLNFTREQNGKPVLLATARSVRGQVSWFSLLTLDQRIRDLKADDLQVFVPAEVPKAPSYPTEERLQVRVTHIEARNATIRIQRRGDHPELSFTFGRFQVGNIGKDQEMTIESDVHNAFPSADLSLNGKFGPFHWTDMKRTPLHGQVRLRHLDLGQFAGAGGTATGSATVSGPFDDLKVDGFLESPDFYSINAESGAKLTFDFSAVMNGSSGNTWFLATKTHFF